MEARGRRVEGGRHHEDIAFPHVRIGFKQLIAECDREARHGGEGLALAEAALRFRQEAIRVFTGGRGDNRIHARAAHERRAAHHLATYKIRQADAGRDVAAGSCFADLAQRGERLLQDEGVAQHSPRCRARQTKLGQGEIVGFQLLGAQDGADDRIRIAHRVAQRKVGHGGSKPHGSGKANGAECARHGIHLRNNNFCGNCNNSFIFIIQRRRGGFNQFPCRCR